MYFFLSLHSQKRKRQDKKTIKAMDGKPINKSNRITSIDSLRAFVLLGVFFTHTWAGFSVKNAYVLSSTSDRVIDLFIRECLQFKCAMIFNMLFGISFYLILRNPANSSGKFVWRCFLLAIFGILLKFFYWPDALMWYGFCGMFLVAFRHLSVKGLVLSVIFFYALAIVLSSHDIGSFLFNNYISDFNRYDEHASFADAFRWWPSAIIVYLRHMFNNGIFYTFANFLIGYALCKSGLVERMDRCVSITTVIVAFLAHLPFLFIPYEHNVSFVLKAPVVLTGAFFYAVLFVYIYNRHPFHQFLRLFEPYGRLGLTNYSMQGVVGVMVLCHCGLGFMQLSLTSLLFLALCFFIFQACFSYWWLQRFTYGPFEYLWRCAIERKWLPWRKKLC